ncbi:hypothetical protein [Rhizobium lusitanum]|uniref:Formyltetrahydrofolate synthetase n=1 Tax=Rhizobium lusitanum TaxID=293958 RepID=A0A7X0IPH9_9HYPH|nr:hypothetical protein [Rhizobium lusitanum]MBB6484759.1 formyltetrahydrofolate synthetase [Rhizobium lusitanum]
MVLLASGALNGWPLDTERQADGLQKQMTDCDRNIDVLMRFRNGEAGTEKLDRKVVEGRVKTCLGELKNYFYVTVARTKLKARGVSTFSGF